jgi:hypothetical protein
MSKAKAWTREQYEAWREMWSKSRPTRPAPTFEEMNSLVEMFDFTFEELTIGREL